MKRFSALILITFAFLLSACGEKVISKTPVKIEGVYKKMIPGTQTVLSSYTFKLDGTVVAQRGSHLDPIAPYVIEKNTNKNGDDIIKVGGSNPVDLVIMNPDKIGYAGGVFEK